MHLPIETQVLANGLRVIVSEDRSTPVVAVNLWYHVGSANEREGRTGFAHLFEHMLFQGSEQVAANEHFELIQRAGGTVNGSTWLDRTNYFETVPSNHWELALWLEADRMARLLPAMTQEKLDTQRDVVKNERHWTVDNQPYGTWWERLPALAFPPTHPYHHSLIGSIEDLDAASLEDVAAFFATYYRPDNAVLSIVGDVSPNEAFALVEKHFGDIARGPVRPPLAPMEVPDRFGAWKRERVADDVTAARLFLAFRLPPFGTPDHAAATVVTTILGAGRGSRLNRRLVRERRVATSAGAFTYDLTKGSDLLVVDVMARPEIGGADLETDVVAVIDELRATLADADEIHRAKRLFVTDFLASMQSVQSRADKLSQFATYFGDPHRVGQYAATIEQVTAEDVVRVISERLGPDNRLSLLFEPRVTV